MKTCSLCGFDNPDDHKHCGSCGSRLGIGAPGRCPDCGFLVGPRDKFCTDCGASLPSEGGSWDPAALVERLRPTPAPTAAPASLDPSEKVASLESVADQLIDLDDTDSGIELGDVPTAAMRAPVRLTGVVGKSKDKVFILPSEGGVIGRSEDADVALEGDFYVEDQHARIGRDAGGIYLEDLGSTNGSFVRAGERFNLKAGDEVKIGQSIFRVEK